MASISLSETGVRFGWREAVPPTAVFLGGAGTSELDLELRFWLVPPFVDVDWEAEPTQWQSWHIKKFMG